MQHSRWRTSALFVGQREEGSAQLGEGRPHPTSRPWAQAEPPSLGKGPSPHPQSPDGLPGRHLIPASPPSPCAISPGSRSFTLSLTHSLTLSLTHSSQILQCLLHIRCPAHCWAHTDQANLVSGALTQRKKHSPWEAGQGSLPGGGGSLAGEESLQGKHGGSSQASRDQSGACGDHSLGIDRRRPLDW